jgi:hypothetical protein
LPIDELRELLDLVKVLDSLAIYESRQHRFNLVELLPQSHLVLLLSESQVRGVPEPFP